MFPLLNMFGVSDTSRVSVHVHMRILVSHRKPLNVLTVVLSKSLVYTKRLTGEDFAQLLLLVVSP